MATFHVVNFGCRASQADGAALKRQLRQAGFEECARPEQSELAVINTCTVTAAADAEARQAIRRLHRRNPRCRIVVTGCYAQRAPGEISCIPGVAWVVGNSHKHGLAELLGSPASLREAGRMLPPPSPDLVQIQPGGATLAARIPTQVVVGEIPSEFHFVPAFPDDRTRPTLKIQDGCNARCSFCVIPYVRGRSRSLMPEKVIEQVRELDDRGYKEIVLSGINLGSYGKDLGRRIAFLGLLERLLAETSVPRLRVSSIEPMDVSTELISLVKTEPRLARHFHVPLQSGCDRILRLMSRRYWRRQYAERILAIREAISDCGIGADVMAGFPGETDQDHAASMQFIEALPFTYLHVFPFSPRPMTPAASFPGGVDRRVVSERSAVLRTLAARKRQGFLASQIGRTLSVLTLDEKVEGSRVALSSNYLKVLLPVSGAPENVLLDVTVGRVADGALYAWRVVPGLPISGQAAADPSE